MGDDNEATVHAHPTSETALLEQRLAAATARTREVQAVRATSEAKRELADRVEAAEREAADEEAIAKAEEEHGAKKIDHVNTDLGCVIVKRPNAVLFKRFQDKGQTKSQELEKLVRPCVIHPDHAMLDRIFDEYPATLAAVANCVCILAGVRTEEMEGK